MLLLAPHLNEHLLVQDERKELEENIKFYLNSVIVLKN